MWACAVPPVTYVTGTTYDVNVIGISQYADDPRRCAALAAPRRLSLRIRYRLPSLRRTKMIAERTVN